MKKFLKGKFATVLIIVTTVLLAGLAVFTAFRLYKLRQEAVAPTAPTSKPAAQTTCVEQCPDSRGYLLNCSPPDGPESDGTPVESICNSAGRVEWCGGRQYCCPSAGGAWTTDMSACETAESKACEELAFTLGSPTSSPTSSPTASPTTTATATSSPTASPTTTATATSSPTGTSTSLPEAGTSASTIAGLSVGIILLILSLALAL